jgi:cation transport ATPase
MATPLALIRGGGEAARNGILMCSGDAFQVFQEVEHIVLDKTGTITEGKPAVDTVVGVGGEVNEVNRSSSDGPSDGDHAEVDVLGTAASAEAFSEHPLATAILDHAAEHDVDFPDPDEFDSVTGKGVTATVDGDDVVVGKPGWLEAEGIDLSTADEEIERLQGEGLTTIGVVVREARSERSSGEQSEPRDGDLIGLVGIGDGIKPDATATIDRMKAQGITPVMITGDNERTAQAVADEIGIKRVMAEVLPDDKREEIKQIQNEGHRVAMVGDGINDAPALTQADIGIAIGAGTDIAIESADIVLMGDRLGGVVDAYEIGETSYEKTKQNLIAAFSFNGLGVTAAVTGLVHPVFAMLAMAASVTLVLANSFAGQLLSGEGIETDFSVETVETEEAEEIEEEAEPEGTEAVEAIDDKPARETVTFDVDLNCGGCEERIVSNLSDRDGVRGIEADADERRAEIGFNPHVTSPEDLRGTIEDLGYEATEPTPAAAD